MPRQQTPVKTWIIAVLAVLVIGQAGYFLFVLPEQERSHIAEIEQQVQQQSAVPPLAREASDPPQSSQSTASAAVSAPAPADAQASVEQLRQQQQLRDGIGFSHVLRTEIAVFLAEHGRLPADIGELAIDGLTPPPAVAKAEISAGGRIVLQRQPDSRCGCSQRRYLRLELHHARFPLYRQSGARVPLFPPLKPNIISGKAA